MKSCHSNSVFNYVFEIAVGSVAWITRVKQGNLYHPLKATLPSCRNQLITLECKSIHMMIIMMVMMMVTLI